MNRQITGGSQTDSELIGQVLHLEGKVQHLEGKVEQLKERLKECGNLKNTTRRKNWKAKLT